MTGQFKHQEKLCNRQRLADHTKLEEADATHVHSSQSARYETRYALLKQRIGQPYLRLSNAQYGLAGHKMDSLGSTFLPQKCPLRPDNTPDGSLLAKTDSWISLLGHQAASMQEKQHKQHCQHSADIPKFRIFPTFKTSQHSGLYRWGIVFLGPAPSGSALPAIFARFSRLLLFFWTDRASCLLTRRSCATPRVDQRDETRL